MQLFNHYFHSVYQPNHSNILDNFDFTSSVPPSLQLQEFNCSEYEIYNILSFLVTTKALAINTIGPKLLKFCAISLYVPITLLLQKCIYFRCIPKEWKIHLITPILNSGDPANVANYRPISLLCSISKVLERVLFNPLPSHFLPYISPSQFGFMKGRSCLHQLLFTLLSIHNNSRSHIPTNIIYLDFKKDFDSVTHEQLFIKLWKSGITCSA